MSTTFTFAAYEAGNIYRRPDWRHARIRRTSSQGTRLSTRDDEYTKEFKRFYTRYQYATETDKFLLQAENPALFAAMEIYEKSVVDPSVKFLIEARILTGESLESIADGLGCDPDTIFWYEKIFFNVLDRLDNPDYIFRAVIVPAYRQQIEIPGDVNPDDYLSGDSRLGSREEPALTDNWFDGTLKLFAYRGGQMVLDTMVNNCPTTAKPKTANGVNEWLDEFVINGIKRKAAQIVVKLKINKYNAMELLKINAELISAQKALESGTAIGTQEYTTEVAKISQRLVTMWQFGDNSTGRTVEGKDVPSVIDRFDSSSAVLRAEESMTYDPRTGTVRIGGDVPLDFPHHRALSDSQQKEKIAKVLLPASQSGAEDAPAK